MFKTDNVTDFYPQEKMLAQILHSKLCCSDGQYENCKWCTEESWDDEEHKMYLEKANNLLELGDYNTVMKLTRNLF